ncbi:MAG: polyprenyl synthetase family protein, partial [Desulfobacterales bacterium]
MLSLIMVDLKSYIVQKNRLVNTALETYLQESPHSQHLLDAMTYSLMAGGKRIRPILCLAAAEAVGGKGNDALPAA